MLWVCVLNTVSIGSVLLLFVACFRSVTVCSYCSLFAYFARKSCYSVCADNPPLLLAVHPFLGRYSVCADNHPLLLAVHPFLGRYSVCADNHPFGCYAACVQITILALRERRETKFALANQRIQNTVQPAALSLSAQSPQHWLYLHNLRNTVSILTIHSRNVPVPQPLFVIFTIALSHSSVCLLYVLTNSLYLTLQVKLIATHRSRRKRSVENQPTNSSKMFQRIKNNCDSFDC